LRDPTSKGKGGEGTKGRGRHLVRRGGEPREGREREGGKERKKREEGRGLSHHISGASVAYD